jgi:hypothetical protein
MFYAVKLKKSEPLVIAVAVEFSNRVFIKIMRGIIKKYGYFHTVIAGIQIFVPSFYKIKYSLMIVLLSSGCEVLHNCLLLHYVSRTFTLPTSLKLWTMTQFPSLFVVLTLTLYLFQCLPAIFNMLHYKDMKRFWP